MITGPDPKRFTGFHMTAILVAFFGVVIAVNMVMATYATRTFGGVVVENSYVASQNFNTWLKEARTERKLGWNPRLGVDSSRRVTLSLEVAGAAVTGYAEHPLGRLPDVPLSFTATGTAYRSIRPLPAGRWTVHLLVRHAGEQARLVEKLS
jgi:nitrogen fixation protein FixH